MYSDDNKETRATPGKFNRFPLRDEDYGDSDGLLADAEPHIEYAEKKTQVRKAPNAKTGETIVDNPPEEMESVGLLYCRSGVLKGQVQQLKKRRNEVGRAADCDFVIDDDHVSGHHGAVVLDDGAWKIVDFASANGTFLNGKRLGNDCPLMADLKDDDTVKMGKSEFVFKQIKI